MMISMLLSQHQSDFLSLIKDSSRWNLNRTLHSILPFALLVTSKQLSCPLIFIIMQDIWVWTWNSVNLSKFIQLSSLRKTLDYLLASRLLSSLLCILHVTISSLSLQEQIVHSSFHKVKASLGFIFYNHVNFPHLSVLHRKFYLSQFQHLLGVVEGFPAEQKYSSTNYSMFYISSNFWHIYFLVFFPYWKQGRNIYWIVEINREMTPNFISIKSRKLWGNLRSIDFHL